MSAAYVSTEGDIVGITGDKWFNPFENRTFCTNHHGQSTLAGCLPGARDWGVGVVHAHGLEFRCQTLGQSHRGGGSVYDGLTGTHIRI